MDSILNHSYSDRSFSSPASRASTRGTTPEFDPSTSATNGIENMRMCGMDTSNSFQPREHRYSSEISPVFFRRYQQQQQQQQHQHAPMRHMLTSAAAPRSLDAPSWRMGVGAVQPNLSQSHAHYHTPSPTTGPEHLVMGSMASERHGAVDSGQDMGVDTTGFHAYCLDRGNGNYTRLIPADQLPPLVGIPAVQNETDGMLVLPGPRAVDPQNPSGGSFQPVTFKTPPPSPAPVSDALQKRIDHIVASSPAPPKKPKIYCDKWVHEGVCAFTQQGCKYKHEMPLDKATQHSLGLFHGLPTWWKKQQAELQRLQQQQEGRGSEVYYETHQAQQAALPSPVRSEKGPVSPARASHSWRRIEAQGSMGSISPTRQNAGGYRSSTEPTSAYQQNMDVPASSCVWGPIGPPSKQAPDHGQMYHQNLGAFGSNNFALMSSLEDKMVERCAGSRSNAA